MWKITNKIHAHVCTIFRIYSYNKQCLAGGYTYIPSQYYANKNKKSCQSTVYTTEANANHFYLQFRNTKPNHYFYNENIFPVWICIFQFVYRYIGMYV